ncbi:hypothetical protein B0H16DRAFT_1475277 [Mycena metata]|uniref:Uncharacterized protein n=1 Tax=Mycena metata TaxID=1033252 RepID=A0AAD7MIZ7_9AGAR|nr:hypothetical protein B0H16DRAFT_1475277 [Mycena metata]
MLGDFRDAQLLHQALINHKFFRGRQIEFEPWKRKLNHANDRRNSSSGGQQHALGPFMVSLDKELQGWWLTTSLPKYDSFESSHPRSAKVPSTRHSTCKPSRLTRNTKMGFHLMPKGNSGPDSCKGTYTGAKGHSVPMWVLVMG